MSLEDLCDAVDRPSLRGHLTEFARRVKLSGTPAELESFHYLEKRMRDYGFHTSLILHDAFISLPGTCSVEVDGRALRSITHSMSKPTGAAGIRAELVYIGAGDAAAFKEVEVAGRIALVDGIATEEVAHLASRAGAVGQLHISPTEHLYEMCISPVWGNPSQHTRSELPTAAAATISRDDGAVLRERCRRGEKVVASMRTEVDTGWRKTPLLVAELDRPETSEDAPFVLLSGHHDTWHYGVMDNGTANATMLEAARLLARERTAWRRGLRVCFWSGHSHGRYSGSAWYADEHWLELERRCTAHVNVDSTGGIGASVVTNSGVVEELAPLAADVVRAVTGQSHAGRRQARAADQSFWGIGIPSMFGSISHQPAGPVKMLTALGWWWHTPHDLIDKIDEDNLVRDTRIVLGVLWRLLTDRILPFDFAAYAHALLRQLDELAKQLGHRLDLGPIRREVAGLQEKAEILADHACVVSTDDAPINEALMRASRALVPINYTTGQRFRHDSALPHTPWPALDGIRELAAAEIGPSELPFLVVHARQTRNRIAYGLAQANQSLAAALQAISGSIPNRSRRASS